MDKECRKNVPDAGLKLYSPRAISTASQALINNVVVDGKNVNQQTRERHRRTKSATVMAEPGPEKFTIRLGNLLGEIKKNAAHSRSLSCWNRDRSSRVSLRFIILRRQQKHLTNILDKILLRRRAYTQDGRH